MFVEKNLKLIVLQDIKLDFTNTEEKENQYGSINTKIKFEIK